MDHVVVIGGGFAGLSSAAALSEAGVAVTLLERSRHLGGRARSFADRHTGDTVDNGQHLFMRCYRHTRDFLSRIGTSDRLHFQNQLRIDFHHPQHGHARLSFPPRLPAPFHMLVGLLRFSPIGLSDILGLRRISKALALLSSPDLSVDAWLDRCGQSARIREAFLHPLCFSALNQRPEAAPARHLAAVLREAFFGEPDGACLGYARVGLSTLYTAAARRFVEQRGGHVRTGTAATHLSFPPDGPANVHLRSAEILPADACICAVPPPALARLLRPDRFPDLIRSLSEYRPSPILSVNLWFDRPVIASEFVGLLEGQMHWAFNKPALYGGRDRASEGHIVMVASAAGDLVDRPDRDLVEIALGDLRTLAPALESAHLRHHLVIRERHATFHLPLGQLPPGCRTVRPDVFLAGDWTDTGLPATIESAVSSGHRAAENAMCFLKE